MKKELISCSLKELEDVLSAMGEKPFRAKQIYQWLLSYTPIDGMLNLPASLREKLEGQFSEGYLPVIECLTSKDGTQKYLLQLRDGHVIESVAMHYEYGTTICISTQVGCAMACSFCASAKGGFFRNLEKGELLSQVLCLNTALGGKRSITNIVLMGTGEPLLNYENVVGFLRSINARENLNISYRNISLSTCGVVPQIKKLAEEGIPLTLCLSMHAASDEKRRQIMPIALNYTLDETIDAMKYYYQKTARRIVIEYVVLKGFNDGKEDVELLAKRLLGLNCHINLIAFNQIKGSSFVSPAIKQVHVFAHQLEQKGLSVTVRRSLGQDIEGACGQLRAKYIG